MRVSFFLFAFFFFLTLLPGNTGSLRYLHSVHPSPSFYVSGRRAFYFYPIYLRTPLDIIVRVLQSLFFRFPHVFRTFVAFRSFLPLGPPVGPPLCPRSMVSAPLCAVLVASCSVSFLFFFFEKFFQEWGWNLFWLRNGVLAWQIFLKVHLVHYSISRRFKHLIFERAFSLGRFCFLFVFVSLFLKFPCDVSRFQLILRLWAVAFHRLQRSLWKSLHRTFGFRWFSPRSSFCETVSPCLSSFCPSFLWLVFFCA